MIILLYGLGAILNVACRQAMKRALLISAFLLRSVAPPPRAPRPIRCSRGDHLYGRYCISCHGRRTGSAASESARDRCAPRTSTGAAPSLRGVGALAADFYLRTGYMPLRQVGMQPRRSRVLS